MKVAVSTFAEQQRLLAQAEALDWPTPEEIIQSMAEALLTRCAGDYGAAHAAVDGYCEREQYPLDSGMYIVMALMSWCEDKSEAHEKVEQHRQVVFPWWWTT